MHFSVGPELTDKQQRQRDETYRAARILQEAGISFKVHELWSGVKNPNSDSAVILIKVSDND